MAVKKKKYTLKYGQDGNQLIIAVEVEAGDHPFEFDEKVRWRLEGEELAKLRGTIDKIMEEENAK